MTKEEIIKQLVNHFANLVNVRDDNIINSMVTNLSNMDESDAVDFVIRWIYGKMVSQEISKDDVINSLDTIAKICPSKYNNARDIMDRFNFLRKMNLISQTMPLAENHKVIIETFDKFNELVGTEFDAYYTGGLMGYIATNTPLQRYHSDLDLFINEEQLPQLFSLIEQSQDFMIENNLDKKTTVDGHEYDVSYKNGAMKIGLFLFSRDQDNSIIIKNYYHANNDLNSELFVDERHLSKENSELSFSNQIRMYNNHPYKMQSLESIYNSKKNSRPKDQYDAKIIESSINPYIEQRIENSKKDSYLEQGKVVKKVETKKDVQRRVLTKPDNKNGYVNPLIVYTVIIFICGIGVGIGYILFHLN